MRYTLEQQQDLFETNGVARAREVLLAGLERLEALGVRGEGLAETITKATDFESFLDPSHRERLLSAFRHAAALEKELRRRLRPWAPFVKPWWKIW